MTPNLAHRIIFLILLALLVTCGGTVLALSAPEPVWRSIGLFSMVAMVGLALAWAHYLARPLVYLLGVLGAHLRGERDFPLSPEVEGECDITQSVHSLLRQARATEASLTALREEMERGSSEYSQAIVQESAQRQHLETALDELRQMLSQRQADLESAASERQRLQELLDKLVQAANQHQEAIDASIGERQRLEVLLAERAEALTRREEAIQAEQEARVSERSRAELERVALEAERERLAGLVVELQGRLSEREAAFEAGEARWRQVSEAWQGQEAERALLAARVAELEGRLTVQTAAAAAGEARWRAQAESLAALEAERQRLSEQAATLEERLAEREAQVLERLRHHQGAAEELTLLQGQLEGLRATQDALVAVLGEREGVLETVQAKLAEALATGEEQQARLTEQERQLGELSRSQATDRQALQAARAEVAASRQFLSQITDHMGEGIYVLDAEGRLTYMNPEAERLLGWACDELVGRPAHDIIHYQNPQGETVPAAECPVHKTIQSGQVMRVAEDVFTRRDGQLVPVAFVASPLIENGRVTGSVTVFQDIARRKQVEREVRQARDVVLEASRLKSEFLANMSHELRTPMNGVIGMTDLLLDSKLNKDQRELATTVRESAQALLTMVNDILDFAKIEAGKLEIEASDFDPVAIVEGVVELLAPQAFRKGLDLLPDVSPKIPRLLRGDAGRLRQVLLNLTGNALKFTKKGEVVINALLEEQNDGLAHLRFLVKDTGIGVPTEVRSRLFLPFTQGDGSASRSFGGAGLGLSIAKRLVELMGGEIGYQSRKGRGSVFWFTIPLSLPSSQEEERSLASTAPHASLRGRKCLVVVRHHTTQTILLNLLLSWNLRVAATESLAEALAALHEQTLARDPFDLVLVDVGTDASERFAFGRQVLGDAELQPTRLILLTACTHPEHLQQAKEAGFVAALIKPLLRDRVRQALLTALQTPDTELTAGEPVTVAPVVERNLRQLVLLAEDNVVNQRVTQLQLKRLGYQVHVAANGREALEAMTATRYALVLMDCQMPVMDGLEATRRVRELEQADQRERTPIIALTANAMHGDRESCLEAGMDDYIGKPVDYEDLGAKLRHWLERDRESSAPEIVQAPMVAEVQEAATEEAAPVSLELARLREYFGNDERTVREFVMRYLSRTGLVLAHVRKAIRQKDGKAVASLMREHGGVSANVGATALAEICKEMEEQALASRWGRCRNLLAAMTEQFGVLESQVTQL